MSLPQDGKDLDQHSQGNVQRNPKALLGHPQAEEFNIGNFRQWQRLLLGLQVVTRYGTLFHYHR